MNNEEVDLHRCVARRSLCKKIHVWRGTATAGASLTSTILKVFIAMSSSRLLTHFMARFLVEVHNLGALDKAILIISLSACFEREKDATT